MNKLFVLIIASTVLSFLITPLIKRFAVRIKVIDTPRDERRIHKKPIPLLGGLAIYLSFIVVLILFNGNILNNTSELGIVLGATVITIGGFLDDAYDLKPLHKLAFQVGAACILLSFNIKISVLTNPFHVTDTFMYIGLLSIPFTIIWVVGITNALNLIDGLDGLAAGVALISCVTIFFVSLIQGRGEAAILTAVLSGAILGFLPYNFNPASIFMGDTGAQLLGFLLAAISIEGAIKSATAFAIAVPILALGLPIYDTLFAMVRRKVNGKPIMAADRGHLHHRLIDMGLTQRQAVIIMYMISACLGGVAILAMQISNVQSYFLLVLVMMLIIALAWKIGFLKHKE